MILLGLEHKFVSRALDRGGKTAREGFCVFIVTNGQGDRISQQRDVYGILFFDDFTDSFFDVIHARRAGHSFNFVM
jgi:hypothetical protein